MSGAKVQARLQDAAAFWPTPTVNGNYNRKGLSATSGDGLATAVTKFPTPCATDGQKGGPNAIRFKKDLSLPAFAARYPTPTSQDAKNSTLPVSQRDRDSIPGHLIRSGENGGSLNPTWVEWLMGWPLGWTDLRPLGTDKFQQWSQAHGGF